MARPKKIETPVVSEVIETPVVSEEPRNMSVMMKDTKEVKNIKKSEYNYLIHICI